MIEIGIHEIKCSTPFIRHRYFTEALGSLVAQTIPMNEIHKILDVRCGPGPWVIDMAKTYPMTDIVGIDTDEVMLREAQMAAHLHDLRNTSFLAMDITRPLTFCANTFDLAHMSYMPSIPFELWPSIVTELARIVRPGGWLHLVEFEPGSTSNLEFNRLIELIMVARSLLSHAPKSMLYTPLNGTVWQADSTQASEQQEPGLSQWPCQTVPLAAPQAALGRAFQSILRIGNAAHLYGFLLNANLIDVSYTVHAIDLGFGNKLGARDFLATVLMTVANFKPLLCGLDLIAPDTFDDLFNTARENLLHPDSCGYAYLISATGCKDG